MHLKAKDLALMDGVSKPESTWKGSPVYKVRCPAHGGKGRNCSVWDWERDGKSRVHAHCHSRNCDQEEILAAFSRLAGPLRKRFGPGSGAHACGRYCAEYEHPAGPRKVHREDYPGPCGREGCEEPGPHKHVWGKGSPKGCKALLWEPEGASAGDPVVLVEGEKAAWHVREAGLTAASWRGGAAVSFRAEGVDWSPLRGRSVRLWPDDDEDGARAMRLALQALARHTADAWILEPPGYDGASRRDAADYHPETIREVALQARRDARPQPTASPPDYAELVRSEGLGRWRMNPLADAVRLLRFAPGKLLVAKDHRGECEVLFDAGTGVWRRDAPQVQALALEAAFAWHHAAEAALVRGELQARDVQRAYSWALRLASPRGLRDCLEQVGVALVGLAKHDELPRGLTVAPAARLDADRLCLGAPNGVADLASGKLLPPAAARRRLVTRSTPVEFRPRAAHADCDALTAHLPEAERSYLLDALGWALRGFPGRRWYILAGEPSGGKTTLLDAALSALGPVRSGGYGMSIQSEAIQRSSWSSQNSHQGGLFGIQDARLCAVGEIKGKVRFDSGLVKDVTGNTPLAFRDVGEKAGPSAPARATLVLACNSVDIEALDLSDSALLERTRILPYPRLPSVDPEMAARVREDPEVAMAVLARLVRRGAALSEPPGDIPSVTDAVSERRALSIGSVGAWLAERVRVTGNDSDRLAADALMAALAEDIPPDSRGLHENRSRKQVLMLLRDVHPSLPPGRRLVCGASGSAKRFAWRGVRLVPAAEREEKAEDDDPLPF